MQASFGQHNEPLSPEFSRVDHSGQNVNPNILGYGQTGVNPQNAAYNLALNNAESSSPVNQANNRTETEENRKLKQRLDDLINFRDQFEDGTEVKKKIHYNKESA